MPEPDPIAELLARVAEEHAFIWQVDGDFGEHQWVECMCDSEYFIDTPAGEDEHRAHLAEAQAAALRAAGHVSGGEP